MSHAYKIEAAGLEDEATPRSEALLAFALRQHTTGEGASEAIGCAQRGGMLKALHNAMVWVRETFHPAPPPRLEVDEQGEAPPLFIFAVDSRREPAEAARLKRALLLRIAQEPTTRPHVDQFLFYVAAAEQDGDGRRSAG